MTVLRVVWGRVGSAGLSALADAFQDASAQGRQADGLVAWNLGIRPSGADHAVAGFTVWDTADHALVALGEDLPSNPTLGRLGAAAEYFRADFYEIEAARVHTVRGDTAFLRVATGLLPSLSEAEILGEMRQRLPLVGPEVVEAYVGRRLVGRRVEVAFVSVWVRIPDVRQLEMPLWPDLASRKESFTVQTFFVVRGGIAAASRALPADLASSLAANGPSDA